MRRVLQSAVLIATLTFPALAHGQGTVRGAEEGAAAGGAAGGPIGAIVGGTVGAATGTVGAILGVDERPRFRGVSHRIAFHVAILAGVILVAVSGDRRAMAATAVYATLLAGMFGVSATLHRADWRGRAFDGRVGGPRFG